MSEAPEHEAEVADLPDTGADAGGQDDAAPQLSAEDRALAMGWTPKGQFKGDPEKWVDADTFVKRGEEFLPFLKANNRRLEQALDRANTKMASLEKAVSGAIKHISQADQRAYAKARAELDAELEQAATSGNAEDVKAITKDIVALEREVSDKPADGPEPNPDFDAWQEANPWFGKDKAMTAATVAIGEDVLAEGYTGKAQIKEVDRRIREQFPEKFAKPENPNRRHPGAVEGGGNAPRRTGKTYADLPAEAKKMCDEFVRDIKGFTRDKFVKDYDWS